MVEDQPIVGIGEHLVDPFEQFTPERMQKRIDESGKHDFDDPLTRYILPVAEDHGSCAPLAFQQS